MTYWKVITRVGGLSWIVNTSGPNFTALLTVSVSKESARAEAGNSVLASSVIHWLAGYFGL